MLIPVLGGKGKTFLISGIIEKFRNVGISSAAFIPFEADLTAKNIADIPTDAEIFAQSAGEGHFPFGLYTSYGPHPFRFFHEAEGYMVKPEKVSLALKKCEDYFGVVWVELNGGLLNEISEDQTIVDWVKKIGNKPLYIFDTEPSRAINSLIELEFLVSQGMEVSVIINNSTDTLDIHWIEYLKNKVTKNLKLTFLSLLDFDPEHRNIVSDELLTTLVDEFGIRFSV